MSVSRHRGTTFLHLEFLCDLSDLCVRFLVSAGKNSTFTPPFTPPAPPATRTPPPPPIKSTAQAPPKRNQNKDRCNWLPPTPPITPTDYAWLVPGLQTRSNSNRLLSDANASNPRRRFPSVLSPQAPQQAPLASQSARLVSSPQDRQCINVSMFRFLLFSCAILTSWVGHKASYE